MICIVNKMILFFFITALSYHFSTLIASNNHCGLFDHPSTCPVACYKIIDLGMAGLEVSQLSKLEPLYSLAPMINNHGQIVYNKADGAYVRDRNIGEYALSTHEIKVFGHGINNNGEILVSLQRSENIEWMVSSKKSSLNKIHETEKWHVDNLGGNTRAFFGSINDAGTVVGYKEQGERLRPLVWTACGGLRYL